MAEVKAALGIVALDAAKSSGWTVMLDGDVVASGQCNIKDLIAELSPYADINGDWAEEWLLVVEHPFVGEHQSKRSVITHSKNCGRAEGILRCLWPTGTHLWSPPPNMWRAKIPGMPFTGSLAKAYALKVARAAGLPCAGSRGGALVDQAESFVIALAAGRWWYAEGQKKFGRGSKK